jgi:hypothetical protein
MRHQSRQFRDYGRVTPKQTLNVEAAPKNTLKELQRLGNKKLRPVESTSCEINCTVQSESEKMKSSGGSK